MTWAILILAAPLKTCRKNNPSSSNIQLQPRLMYTSSLFQPLRNAQGVLLERARHWALRGSLPGISGRVGRFKYLQLS